MDSQSKQVGHIVMQLGIIQRSGIRVNIELPLNAMHGIGITNLQSRR